MNHPYWLFYLAMNYEAWYAKHFLHPQFESVGESCRFIQPKHFDIVGKNIFLGANNRLMALQDAPVRFSIWSDENTQGEINIGDYCVINPGVRLTSASSIRIGNNCMLAMHVYLMDLDGHDLYHRAFAPGNTAPIELKDNVWLGDGVVVCKGVTIGENSVAAARAVVTKDVPPNVVVAGNPAKIIKHLDPDIEPFTRQLLYESGWVTKDHEHAGIKAQLKGNTFLGLLMSKWRPNKNH